MSWKAVPPCNVSDIAVQTSPSGASRQILYEDPESGFRTSVMTMPPGWKSPYSGNGLEFHSSQEEVFNLSGILHFGSWRDFSAPGYLNHPPYWVHPSDEVTDTGLRLLVKYAGPFDINYTPFPENWDGTEFVAAAGKDRADTRLTGVVGINHEDLAWEPVLYQDLTPLKYDAKVLYRNEVTGWTTWLMRIPAGWRGVGMRRSTSAGDELFVLEGDLTVSRPESVLLTEGGYYCDPDRFIDGGSNEFSENGCIAIRWTRDAHHLVLPPVR